MAPTEVAGVDEAVLTDAVATLAVAERLELDSVLAGVVVGSGADAVGGALEFGSVSTGLVVLVCAPPLLLTVTPSPTSVLDDVAPEVFVVPVAVGSVPVDVDPLVEVAPLSVVVDAVPVDGVAVDPVASPVEVELEVLVDDSDDVPVVSAPATPYPVATAAASHAATAMPPYPPSFAALWAALRDGEGVANRGLTGRLSVMGSTPMA